MSQGLTSSLAAAFLVIYEEGCINVLLILSWNVKAIITVKTD